MPTFDRFNFVGTRRLLALVINPRPSVRALCICPAAAPVKYQPYNAHLLAPIHSSLGSPVAAPFSEPYDTSAQRHPSFCLSSQSSDLAGGEFPAEQSELSPLPSADEEVGSGSQDTSVETSDSRHNSDAVLSDYARVRALRSSRHRKSKSVSDADLELSKIKDNPGCAMPSTWPRSNTRSIEWTLSSLADGSSSYRSLCHDSYSALVRTTFAPEYSHKEPQHAFLAPQTPVQENSGCTGTTDYSEYVTAPSYFNEITSTQPQPYTDEVHILQAIDRASGAIFDKICEGTRGEVDVQDAPHLINFNIHTNDLSYHVVPRDWLVSASSQHANHCRLNDHAPSLILTLPTPVVPQSPVFVPQSPITVSKFFSATATMHTSLFPEQMPQEQLKSSLSPNTCQMLAPSLTSCGQCGLSEFDQGLQCRPCNEHWLACKVWYRANDGGRKRWLTEPYIRPGECNERNRAIMRNLGVAGCSLDSSGADASDDSISSQNARAISSTARRALRRLVAMSTVHVRTGLVTRRPRPFHPLGKRAFRAGAERLREGAHKLAGQARELAYSIRRYTVQQRLGRIRINLLPRWPDRDVGRTTAPATNTFELSPEPAAPTLVPLAGRSFPPLSQCPHCGEALDEDVVLYRERSKFVEQFESQNSSLA